MKLRRINPFIKAHGAAPGPFMRPRLTGVVASILAAIPLFAVLFTSGVFAHLSSRFGHITTVVCYFIYSLIAGFLYGSVYRRAANDRKGGWIFGASTGFILWMINPLIWFPWFGLDPVLVGQRGLLVMAMHVCHGAGFGLIYPWVHVVCARKDADISNDRRVIETIRLFF